MLAVSSSTFAISSSRTQPKRTGGVKRRKVDVVATVRTDGRQRGSL
jgi:hypothetical protein